jgi:Protein of unknown function (DUF992)
VAGLSLFALSATPAHAAEKVRVKTGYLTCHEAAGWGFIIGSLHSINCMHTSNKHRTEYYSGSISSSGPTSAICRNSPYCRRHRSVPSLDSGSSTIMTFFQLMKAALQRYSAADISHYTIGSLQGG